MEGTIKRSEMSLMYQRFQLFAIYYSFISIGIV
ncbi:hypothetical protein DES34_101440 [Brevibacillus brevis]|nr:hypothetical protein DES34_101440 [Brevibacillus brevis]VEF89112.1 Uncharacterised protein [Brevibacillus brevis]